MFVKKSYNTKAKNAKPNYSIVESYRNKDGKPRHRTIMNISNLPMETIEAIKLSLQDKEIITNEDIELSTGDAFRGAGTLAIYRLFKNAIFSKVFSKKRLDEDELYDVMDVLYDNFYAIQQRLRDINESSNVLLLYDITSTYFEGTKAEGGEYGYSRDHRSDRYQIVIGLVCNENGLPLSVEVWPGNTADKDTVEYQVKKLKEDFNIKKAILIGDKGMYSETNIEQILKNGFHYILSAGWQTQRRQLLKRSPKQLSLLDELEVLEWEDEDTRYVGCASKWRKKRQENQRIEGVKSVKGQLDYLKKTTAKGKYYSWNSLYKKIEDILKKAKVKDLWNINITPKNKEQSPEEKGRFELEYTINSEAVKERKKREGKFVLETSLSKQEKDAENVKKAFMKQPQIERAFRNIKSFLEIRPVYHWKDRRIKAHVLICFLGFYLTKKAEIEFRNNGITKEAIKVIRNWDKLTLVKNTLNAGKKKMEKWQWSMGEIGTEIKNEISTLNWWRSIQGYKRSLLSQLDE